MRWLQRQITVPSPCVVSQPSLLQLPVLPMPAGEPPLEEAQWPGVADIEGTSSPARAAQMGDAFGVALSWHCPLPGRGHTYQLQAPRRRRWHWRHPGGKGTEGDSWGPLLLPRDPRNLLVPKQRKDTFSFPNCRGNAGAGPPPARADSGPLLTSTVSCQNWIFTGRLSPATRPLRRKAPTTSLFSTELLRASCKSQGSLQGKSRLPGDISPAPTISAAGA